MWYKCLELAKQRPDNLITYEVKVNRECEGFKLFDLSSEQFKDLILVCGLRSAGDTGIRLNLLSKIES